MVWWNRVGGFGGMVGELLPLILLGKMEASRTASVIKAEGELHIP